MTSTALLNQKPSPRIFGCLKGECEHRSMAEADACDEFWAAYHRMHGGAEGEPGKMMSDWREEARGYEEDGE